jgi:protein-disulfide isomerase
MSNRFVGILVACVLVFLGLVFFTKKDANAPNQANVTASNHVQGAGTTGVTLIEYGDFQCPACGSYYPIVKEVQSKYGDKIKFQFRSFPLVGLHPNAMTAHRAAEAADKQGKYWEMHDMLYERQSAWSTSKSAASIFKSYAQELGLDMDRYSLDVASAETQTIINKDIEQGKAINVTATPGFVLDGKLLENNPRDVEAFSALIDAAIAAKKQ